MEVGEAFQAHLKHWDLKNPESVAKVSVDTRVNRIVDEFAMNLVKGRVLIKLGKNGRLLYRLFTLDPKHISLSMQTKGPILEFPFDQMTSISYGYDLTDFSNIPVQIISYKIINELGTFRMCGERHNH